jgi:hypothetical protein
MINLIVIAISAIMFALLLVWWRWPVFRAWIEAPKYSMLCQERRFDDQRDEPGMNQSSMAGTHRSEPGNFYKPNPSPNRHFFGSKHAWGVSPLKNTVGGLRKYSRMPAASS